MAISPFPARPASPGGEQRRARLVAAIAVLGIAATLLAYAISPGVRHAVSHATHSVKHAVGNVLDHDTKKHPKVPAGAAHSSGPAQRAPSSGTTTGGETSGASKSTSPQTTTSR
jgi:hypothetical protein